MFQGFFFDHIKTLFQQWPQADRGQFQFHFPGLHLGKIQDIVDQGEEVTAAVEDIIKIFFLNRVKFSEMFVREKFTEPDDMVQGGSQFMTHVGKKFTFGAIGLFRFLLGTPQNLFVIYSFHQHVVIFPF